MQNIDAQDEYKTLGEQGVDPKGEVQYTVAEFNVGTKIHGGMRLVRLDINEQPLNFETMGDMDFGWGWE